MNFLWGIKWENKSEIYSMKKQKKYEKKTSETKGNLLRLWCANCFCFFQESFRFFPALLLPLLPPQPCFFCSRTLTKLWLTHEKKNENFLLCKESHKKLAACIKKKNCREVQSVQKTESGYEKGKLAGSITLEWEARRRRRAHREDSVTFHRPNLFAY